jgi:hypothetical protein
LSSVAQTAVVWMDEWSKAPQRPRRDLEKF